MRDLPRLGFGRDRVIPLAFHVDYWDGLGWKDPFALPAFTERQQRYIRAGVLVTPDGAPGIAGAYTPQMIIGGHVHLPGGQRERALAAIRDAERQRPSGTILTARAAIQADTKADTASDTVLVDARLSSSGAPSIQSSFRLTIALAQRSARTPVAGGENRGETLQEAAVVRALSRPAPIFPGAAEATRVTVTRPPDLEWSGVELVAFVQSETTLRVVATRSLSLEPAPLRGAPAPRRQ